MPPRPTAALSGPSGSLDSRGDAAPSRHGAGLGQLQLFRDPPRVLDLTEHDKLVAAARAGAPGLIVYLRERGVPAGDRMLREWYLGFVTLECEVLELV